MGRIAANKKFIVVSLVLILLLITYNYTALSNGENNKNTAKVISQHSYVKEIQSIDDVVKASSNIIIGTVLNIESFSDYTDKYIVDVDKNIKGTACTDRIDVYETKDTLKVGDKYILFLQYSESALYPNPKYTSAYKECIIRINGNAVFGNSKFVDDSLSLDKLIKNIESSKNIAANTDKKYNIKDKYNTLDEQIAASDYIASIIPNNIIKTNKYVSLVKAKTEAKLKGNVSDELELLLPADIQKGKKYIVFLRYNNDSLELSAREGSIISEIQVGKWEEINKKLKNNN